MTYLLTRAEQAVSATAMARTFGARLKEVTSGDAVHLVIFKDNEPAAVLIGVDAFQAMQDELEDLRAERLASERLLSLNDENTVSLEDMEARFR
ncbi:type II toxin-antitoxin system Phd/YefM family antitoxin [Pseudomonas kurunegalensis]|nr:type II toxin-antitoxin system Phd/YefM family antitoxin [Pseudomonas kurunegalensis]MDD2133478.1 type II toxin-antitoxin system Phd/YefM family antitoxin [Pseudomonas kurunegalensis]